MKYCHHCRGENRDGARFCGHCGRPLTTYFVSPWNLRALRKSAQDKWISGVCGGLGEYTPLPSWLWRALFLVAFFGFGFGLLAYILLHALMPDASAE